MNIYPGSTLTVDDKSNNVCHYPCLIKAKNADEARGKLLRAAEKLFPGLRIDVRIGLHDNIVDDPETCGIIKQQAV